MKKIEITKRMDEKLSRNPFNFVDLLNKNNQINSYEKFVQDFNLMKNTFKDSIPNFYDESIKYINRMEKFIEECNEIDVDKLDEYIDRNLKNAIYGSNTSQISIKSLFIKNLDNSTERNESTIIQMYQELGYDNLLKYIELLKSPSLLTSYLNDSEKQIVAMHYILFKTNHHSNTKFSRNLTTTNLYKKMENNINDSIKEITNEKDDYINFMNDEKEKYAKWFQESDISLNKLYNDNKKEYTDFMEDSRNKFKQLEDTYSNKLKVEEPSKFMLEKSKEYSKKAIYWSLVTVGLSIILIILLGMILSPEIKLDKTIITVNFFSKDMPIYSSIIILSMVCLIIYVIRIFIKMTISSKHLSEEYRQKYVLTYFYLSLVNAGKVDENLGNIILSILFAKADTGLIKNDSSNEYESIIKTLTSAGK